jgi:hypothetical protein
VVRGLSLPLRLASILVGVVWLGSVAQAASEAEGGVDRVEAIVESSAAKPYPGEMVLLRVRTTLFGKALALEQLVQPALQNFAWVQLVADRWFTTTIDGREALRIERLLALFPTRSGSLTIDPFVHHLTLAQGDNSRRVVDLKSAPVEVDVEPWTAPKGGPDDTGAWWLPARSLTVTDRWDPDPERIPLGETARRTVVVEASGLGAERLPPEPKLRSPGVITFAHPVERKTLLDANGPIARVVYRWDVRPATAHAAVLEAISIPWFDTTTREMRDAVLPARRIAFAGQDSGVAREGSSWRHRVARSAAYLSGLTAFLVGSAVLLLRPRGDGAGARPTFMRLCAWRDLRPLRRAARSGNARAFRAAVWELSRRDGAPSRAWLAAPPVNAALTALDLHLFGQGESAAPDLRVVVAAIHEARLRSDDRAVDPIAPLDG